jgi:hypothetical protein
MIYPSPMNLTGQFNWEMDKSKYFTFLRNVVRNRGSNIPLPEIFDAAVTLLADYYKRNGKMIGRTDFESFQYNPRSTGMGMGMPMRMSSMAMPRRMSSMSMGGMSMGGMMGGEVSEESLSGGQSVPELCGGKHCAVGSHKTLKLRKGRLHKVCKKTRRSRSRSRSRRPRK